MARDFFGREVKENPQGGRFGYFPTNRNTIDRERQPKDSPYGGGLGGSQSDAKVRAVPQGDQSERPRASDDMSETDRVLAEYGDPNEDAPITVVDTAPKPFKAMQAAIKAGDNELAYKYAKQWVRHVNNVNQNTKNVMNFTQLAMESEGMLPPGATSDMPNRSLLEKDLAQQEAAAARRDPKAAALLQKARREASSDGGPSAQSDWQDRQIATKEFASKRLRPQKDAMMDIYFFFDARDQKSLQMLPEIERLFQRLADGSLAQIAGFTVSPVESSSLEKFKAANSLSLPVVDGSQLVGELGVRSAPTVVFVSRDQGEVVLREQGFKSFAYLDETLKLLQGRS